LFNPGDVVVIDFPGVTGIKRRPTVIVSSPVYHASRPDIVVGLITSQTVALGPTDYMLQDWAQAGLHVPSVFRSFLLPYLPLLSLGLSAISRIAIGQGVCACVRMELASLVTPEPPRPRQP
jgi:mRNA interferase MazF